MKVRLREQVHAINTGARSIHAILLEPFKAQIVTADSDGVVRTFDYLYSKLQNEFMSNLQPFSKATGVRSLYRLNDLYNELLMCCSASGIVSIWRYYSKPDAQVLATSWRTVLPMVRCIGNLLTIMDKANFMLLCSVGNRHAPTLL